MKSKSIKLLISLIFITITCGIFSLYYEKTYAATPTKITNIEITGSGIKKPKSGNKVYLPEVSIKNVTPSDAFSNVTIDTWWMHDYGYIYKSDLENQEIKFDQGEYRLCIFVFVYDFDKNSIDYEKFPEKITVDGYEMTKEGWDEHYIGYSTTFDVKVKNGTKPTIKTEEIAEARKGMEYNVQLSALGSDSITWSVDKNSKLPKGLKVSKDGILSGKPKEAGTFKFKLVASNDYGTDSKQYTLKINKINKISSLKIKSNKIKIPELGKKISIPQISSSSNIDVDISWQYNNGDHIRSEDIKKNNNKYKVGEYRLNITFITKDSTKYIFDYNKLNNTIKVGGLKFKKSGCSEDYIVYTCDLKVAPNKVKNITLKSQNKKLKIKWKKVSGVTGYEIKYSTNKNFKSGNKTIKVTNNKITSKTVKGLKTNKKYYVKIRTYKTVKVDGEKVKIYSGWSKIKNTKIKK